MQALPGALHRGPISRLSARIVCCGSPKLPHTIGPALSAASALSGWGRSATSSSINEASRPECRGVDRLVPSAEA